ncbi:high-affinity nickel-transport family protein [Myxococcota bacterium]|nr:high-affinity nickel-transport family protein [Myxococcota bacterium]
MSPGISALFFGLVLGLRHATDADHVAVVSTLVQREPGRLHAARIAAWWGLGHSATLLGLGCIVLLLGVDVPEGFELAAELLVASMLVVLGVAHLVRVLTHEGPDGGAPMSVARPTIVGVVHGLGGSASIALLALTTMESRALAFAYLVLFCAGTVAGMVALTLLLSWPLAWTVRRGAFARRVAGAAAALFSLALGGALLAEGALSELVLRGS